MLNHGGGRERETAFTESLSPIVKRDQSFANERMCGIKRGKFGRRYWIERMESKNCQAEGNRDKIDRLGRVIRRIQSGRHVVANAGNAVSS